MSRYFIILLLGVAAISRPALAFLLFAPPDFDVVTNSDVMPAGENTRRPSPENPLYYIAVSIGFQDLGKAVAGEKIPPQNQVVQLITTILDRQGYKLATNKNPPKIVIVYSWGSLNANRVALRIVERVRK